MVSKNWTKKFLQESKQWVNEGLIDESLRKRLSERYADKPEYSRLVNTVVTLGSILIGLGILLFVASNWDKLARPLKITIIFCVLSLFHLAGYYFRNTRKDYPGLGEGFLLMSAFSFGAGIWLIAQIFQIHYNFSSGILFWILGILPLVVIYRSWPILTLSSVLTLIWLFSYQSYYFRREGYGFFLLAPVLIALCYWQKQRFSLFVMVVGICAWLVHFWLLPFVSRDYFDYATSALFAHFLLVLIYTFFGFILYGLGLWHERLERFVSFSFLYKFMGMLLITLPAYSLTFAHHYDKDVKILFPAPLAVLLMILSIGGLLLFFKFGQLKPTGPDTKEAGWVMRFFALQAVVAALSMAWPRAASLSFNMLLLIEILGFMYLGFLRHSEEIFRLAIVIFFLDILSRYFDIFWKMMPRSLLFIFGGVILIGGAILVNRKRKEIEGKMSLG